MLDLNKEREAFEAWLFSTEKFKRRNKSFLFMLDDFGTYEDQPVLEHWETWQAAKVQAIPDGFVVVPKEPTQELLNKMQDFFVGAFENGLTGGQSIHCAYIAMIEAQEQSHDLFN